MEEVIYHTKMATGYLNLEIVTLTEVKATSIATFMNSVIDKTEMNSNLGSNRFQVIGYPNGTYSVTGGLFLKNKTYLTKYKDALRDKWQSANKDDIASCKISVVENCTHDEELSTPCVPIILFEGEAPWQ